MAVDAQTVRELLDTVGTGGSIEAQISLDDDDVRCDFALRVEIEQFAGSPLAALAGSLQRYAGTPVEALAAHEVALTRQGVSLSRTDARLIVKLPRSSD